MTELLKRDYFTDGELLVDPYSYFNVMLGVSPVYKLADRDITLVTGFEEVRQVLMDNETFSSVSVSAGPATPLPFTPHGDNITDQIEENRANIMLSDMVTSLDGKAHHDSRSLLSQLFVPSRLKANDEYIKTLASKLVGGIVARGHCDMIIDVATPYVTSVVANLMGVPEDDREEFVAALAITPTPFNIHAPDRRETGPNGYFGVAKVFHRYILDRRANPRKDILTQIAHATYPDGSTPEAMNLANLVMQLFGAGQDTSAKLMGNATRYLCEHRDMQDRLRAEPELIANFIEEMMRLEGSTKVTSRVAMRRVKVGDTEVPAGTILAVVLAGANRDPRRFDDPNDFRLGRPKPMEHLGFGRGAHTCIGAPLVRTEVRMFFTELLKKTREIRGSERHHGIQAIRELDYEPSYGLRGLRHLFIDIVPA